MARNLDQPTVIVIDNSDKVLNACRVALENNGFRVITHSRSAGCVALIIQEDPDLVLIDVGMPLLSGDTIVKLFGKAQPNSETVILLHSNMSASALEAKVLSSGAHGYLQKTDDSFQFVRQVNAWLKRFGYPSGKLRNAARAELNDDEFANRPSGARPSARRVAPPAGEWENEDAPSTERTDPSADVDSKVLFLDDDMAALSAWRREVQSEPYSAEFALSGAQALKRILSNTPPSLVVSDLLMPPPNGIDVYRRAVSEDPSWAERFIFVTGAGVVSELSDFINRFRGTVLEKPLSGEQLRSAIRRAFSQLDGMRRKASRG